MGDIRAAPSVLMILLEESNMAGSRRGDLEGVGGVGGYDENAYYEVLIKLINIRQK